MNTKKHVITILAAAAAVLTVGIAWFFSSFHILSGGVYAKDTQTVDLRGKEISLEEYAVFAEKFPESTILWDIPFQGSRIGQDTAQLSITSLSGEDVALMAQLPQLQQIDATGCRDYEMLAKLIREYPQVQVLCSAEICGTQYNQDSTAVLLAGCTQEELSAIQCLTNVDTIHISNGMDADVYAQLQQYCSENEIALQFLLGNEIIPGDTTELTLESPSQEDLSAAMLITGLEKLHLNDPQAPAETVLALQDQMAGTTVTWNKTLLGMTFSQDATEIDVTDALARIDGADPSEPTPYDKARNEYYLGDYDPLPSAVSIRYEELVDRTTQTQELIAEAEAAMAYFPEAKKLVMVGCFLDNEAMDGFRKAQEANYEVVWTVKCGRIAPRTDATYFMPCKFNVYNFTGEDGINLKYCEDVICIDVGHMHVDNIEFVSYMPGLKYMILGETTIEDISPLANCKELVFLEIQRSRVKDLTPLLECKKLEDLNIGTLPDIDLEVVKEMKWLKTLYMATFRKYLKEVQAALPDTNVKAPVETTVLSNGWRELPNYYAMRDALLMYYMD